MIALTTGAIIHQGCNQWPYEGKLLNSQRKREQWRRISYVSRISLFLLFMLISCPRTTLAVLTTRFYKAEPRSNSTPNNRKKYQLKDTVVECFAINNPTRGNSIPFTTKNPGPVIFTRETSTKYSFNIKL